SSYFDALMIIPDTLRQAWASINNASDSLSEAESKISMAEKLLNSIFPTASGWNNRYISQFLKTYHNLYIHEAWTGMNQVWTKLSSKMQSLMSGAMKATSRFPIFQ